MLAAELNTSPASRAPSTQRCDSFAAVARRRRAVTGPPDRFQTSIEANLSSAPVSASTARTGCTSNPPNRHPCRPGHSPLAEHAAARTSSLVSWIATTSRPATRAAVSAPACADTGERAETRNQTKKRMTRTLAVELAAVAGEGCQAGELGDGLVGQGSHLGHLGHEAGDGPVGNALDRAEGRIELLPQGIAVNEGGDLSLQASRLSLEKGQELIEGAEDHDLRHQAALVGLGRA